MTENEPWKYIQGREGDYPEVYILYSDGNRIKVEANKEERKVRIYIETMQGEIIQSSIANGVITEEKDILENEVANLDEEFRHLSREISSLPDGKILRLIGGHYGVLTEFLGSVSTTSGEDAVLLIAILKRIINLPFKLLGAIKRWISTILERPTVWDIIDVGVVSGMGYLGYLQNFNVAFGSFILMAGALFSGYVDWLFRRKDPYVLKVILMLIPAMYILRLGLIIQ